MSSIAGRTVAAPHNPPQQRLRLAKLIHRPRNGFGVTRSFVKVSAFNERQTSLRPWPWWSPIEGRQQTTRRLADVLAVSFLTAQGKNIVPTEAGLSLFDVLNRADPDLVDPGVTARMEYLLDDVVLGKQEMVGAIDAVCQVAQRIIGKLTESSGGGPPLLGSRGGDGASSPACKTKPCAGNRTRRKGAKSSTGRSKTGGRSRKSLDHDTISDEPTERSAIASAGIPDGASRKGGRKSRKTPPRRPQRATADAAPPVAPSPPSGSRSATETPLRIPYGNKAIALDLGARYRPGGWYAPPGVDLAAFGERGWL